MTFIKRLALELAKYDIFLLTIIQFCYFGNNFTNLEIDDVV